MRIITPEIESYFASLHSRYDEAIPVPFEAASANDWMPTPALCHDNVNDWAERNPHLKVVRGWYAEMLFGGGCRYVSHSVIERDGVLFDITPTECSRPPFIRHVGTQEEFDGLKMAWTGVIYPFIDFLSNEPAVAPDEFSW